MYASLTIAVAEVWFKGVIINNTYIMKHGIRKSLCNDVCSKFIIFYNLLRDLFQSLYSSQLTVRL